MSLNFLFYVILFLCFITSHWELFVFWCVILGSIKDFFKQQAKEFRIQSVQYSHFIKKIQKHLTFNDDTAAFHNYKMWFYCAFHYLSSTQFSQCVFNYLAGTQSVSVINKILSLGDYIYDCYIQIYVANPALLRALHYLIISVQ